MRRAYVEIIIVIISFFILAGISFAQEAEWTATSNQNQHSMALSIASDETFLYIVGIQGNPPWGEVEKRWKADGSLVWSVNTSYYGQATTQGRDTLCFSITCDNSYCYVVGNYITSGEHRTFLDKIDKSDGSIVDSAQIDLEVSHHSIAKDNSNVYIVGFTGGADSYHYNSKWVVRKRKKGDLSSEEWVIEDDPTIENDSARAIISDGAYLYIAGTEAPEPSTKNYRSQFRVEKRTSSTGSLEWWVRGNAPDRYNPSGADSELGQQGFAITADSTYLYIAGSQATSPPAWSGTSWLMQKRKKSDGGLEWMVLEEEEPSNQDRIAYAIACDDNYIYSAGSFYHLGRIDKRRKSDGSLVWAEMLDWNLGHPYSIIIDGADIYIAGSEHVAGAFFRWRIEKIPNYIDIGLRVFSGTKTVVIACEPEGALSSPLRISKDGVNYGVVLVDPGDAMDSGVRIQIQGASGPEIKALRKMSTY